MGEIEGSFRVLQTPGTRLGAQFSPGISTLEPGQSPGSNLIGGNRNFAKSLQIRVHGLDDCQEFFDVDPKALGQTLLSEVFSRGNLTESDYFGLEFQNMQMNWVWLEPTKPIVKQVRRPANTMFRLAVKFFPPDPGQLQEEYTRYLFSMQMKRDLMEGRLICAENTGALLVSHLVQAEIGDYDDVADKNFLCMNKFLPYQEKVKERIVELHCRHHSLFTTTDWVSVCRAVNPAPVHLSTSQSVSCSFVILELTRWGPSLLSELAKNRVLSFRGADLHPSHSLLSLFQRKLLGTVGILLAKRTSFSKRMD